jgi:DNA-binding response OmpR family regulator
MKKLTLLMDDDRTFLQMLKPRLARRGFKIVTAGNESEFWNRAFAEQPDLIIADLELRDKLGPDVYQNFLRVGFDPGIPVVFLSGVAESQTVREEETVLCSKAVGFEEFVKKINE